MDKQNKIFQPTRKHELPKSLIPDYKKAKKLEWWTIVYLLSVIVIMYVTMKSSQAMKAAWLEDILSMIPSICFLVAGKYHDKEPDRHYPFGYHRVYSIAYQLGAFALLSIGVFIFYDSLSSLISGERPTIGSIVLFGYQVWIGWMMLLALLWSAIPAMILGYKKIGISKRLHNKILFTDANTQKADWETAVAAILGIVGIGFGFWWADSVAACFISISVIMDGWKRIKGAVADLIDKVPTTLEKGEVHPLVEKVHHAVLQNDNVKDARIRMREAGEIFFTEIFIIPKNNEKLTQDINTIIKSVKELDWKILDITIMPVTEFDIESQA